MITKLLPERHLEFLRLKGGCTGPSVSTLVKMPHCWKSHVTAQICSRAAADNVLFPVCLFFLYISKVSKNDSHFNSY